jgi:hypothetical protein
LVLGVVVRGPFSLPVFASKYFFPRPREIAYFLLFAPLLKGLSADADAALTGPNESDFAAREEAVNGVSGNFQVRLKVTDC